MNQINNADKERSLDRVLVLKRKDGLKPKSVTGMVDSRLFDGSNQNQLHAVQSEIDLLWHFKYEQGVLPEPLRCKFTSFNKLKKHADDYFSTRNLEITIVKD